MTHEQMVQAVRKSLLADDGRETHHGVYAKRRPVVPYSKPLTVDNLSRRRDEPEDGDFPGCYW